MASAAMKPTAAAPQHNNINDQWNPQGELRGEDHHQDTEGQLDEHINDADIRHRKAVKLAFTLSPFANAVCSHITVRHRNNAEHIGQPKHAVFHKRRRKRDYAIDDKNHAQSDPTSRTVFHF